METGSIAKWNLKEGDKFSVGDSFCEVETDKATVSFDATDEGYIAKILANTGDIKVTNYCTIVKEILVLTTYYKLGRTTHYGYS